MITISLDTSLQDLIRTHPEIKSIMVELGFKSITNPAMLTTVGKYMTLRKGSTLKHIEIDTIVNKFMENGFDFD